MSIYSYQLSRSVAIHCEYLMSQLTTSTQNSLYSNRVPCSPLNPWPSWCSRLLIVLTLQVITISSNVHFSCFVFIYKYNLGEVVICYKADFQFLAPSNPPTSTTWLLGPQRHEAPGPTSSLLKRLGVCVNMLFNWPKLIGSSNPPISAYWIATSTDEHHIRSWPVSYFL